MLSIEEEKRLDFPEICARPELQLQKNEKPPIPAYWVDPKSKEELFEWIMRRDKFLTVTQQTCVTRWTLMEERLSE